MKKYKKLKRKTFEEEDEDEYEEDGESLFDIISPELLTLALSELAKEEVQRIQEKVDKELEIEGVPEPPRRNKIGMNRICRDHLGSSNIPYPEVDSKYERARSKIIGMLRIKKYFRRRKSRK